MDYNSGAKWKPVSLSGNILNEGFDGLIGIEECLNYEFKPKQNQKRKSEDVLVGSKDGLTKKKKRNRHSRKKKDSSDTLNLTPSNRGSTVDSHQLCQDDFENVSVNAWNAYDLPEVILKGISEQGFSYPTEIQSLTLPPAILGRKDILGAAETGSGKTLAFGLPILNAIFKMKCDVKDFECEHPLYALILTPTRELAIQVKNHLQAVAKYSGINIAVVVGGMATEKQERLLNKFPEIVVATPGRLWDLVQLGYEHLTKISNIRFLVIDETDRMLESGHFQELQNLLEKINADSDAKKQRQNFVFSATLTLVHDLPKYLRKKKSANKLEMTCDRKLKKIIQILGITDPKIVDITKGIGLSTTLTEGRVNCSIQEKDYYVYYFLKKFPGRCIIFCNSIGCVKRLTTLLTLLECNPLPLHASMMQKQRLKNLEKFTENRNSILVATDVAARGLDIPLVEYVLHYQIPRTGENYIHRSGRTARASEQGLTLLLIDSSELQNYIKVCKALNKSEDIAAFPIQQNRLEAVKQRVNLAREIDKLQLYVKKTNSEAGWFRKVSEEMDIIVDDISMKNDPHEALKYRRPLEVKRKQLSRLLKRPIFLEIAGKYPLLNNGPSYLEKTSQIQENAIEVMKNSSGKGNKISIYKPKKHVKNNYDSDFKKTKNIK